MMIKVAKEQLEALLTLWSNQREVWAPSLYYGEISLMPYKAGPLNLDYINFAQPIKEFVFKGREKLFKWEAEKGTIAIQGHLNTPKERLIFGVRSCDAQGLDYMDRFYGGEICDDLYCRNREKMVIVVLNCIQPGSGCFCTSVDGGPFAKSGFDLAMTPIEDYYLLESATDSGRQLITEALEMGYSVDETEAMSDKEKLRKRLEGQFKRGIQAENVREVLYAHFDDEIWQTLADTCIRCGGCTNVCPTCTCYNVVEEPRDPFGGFRIRAWDSCQCDAFTNNAGGHNPRDAVSRVRYRIFDKLAYIEERFGHKGCTGCGRCTAACPVDIDIVRIAKGLSEKFEAVQSQMGEEAKFNPVPVLESVPVPASVPVNLPEDQHVHGHCESAYVPEIAEIVDVIEETKNIKRFFVKYEDEALHERFQLKGQFFEISVFGVGEVAISIPFATEQKDVFDFCIKKVGKVTRVLHNLKPGDKIGLRGPFGKGFPVDQMAGKDILIIGSGVGVAPVRMAVLQIEEQRRRYGKVAVIGSAVSYEDLIYKDDFKRWKSAGLEVQYALSRATDKVDAFVGRINDLLPDLSLDYKNTCAIVCASPRRIREVAKDLIALGMDSKDIYTSLETHMRCGIGKCGHCKVGSKYMCVDGPVFNYEEMLSLPPEF